MATITIPTPISTTCQVINSLMINSDTEGIQTLLNNTDFTIESPNTLCYKNIPFLIPQSYNGSFRDRLCYYNDALHNAPTKYDISEGCFSYASWPVNIYNFQNYIIFCTGKSIGTIDDSTSSSKNVIIIDTVNNIICDGFNSIDCDSLSKSPTGVLGTLYIYKDENDTIIYDRFFPNDPGTPNIEYRRVTLRRESVSNCTYSYLCGYQGKISDRVAIFTTFPRASSGNVLNVNNKYFYLLGYDQTLSPSYNQEMHCTIGIDVTDEINS